VIEAIADGKRAAAAIDAYLKKAGKEKGKAAAPLLKFNPEYYKKTMKLRASRIPVSQRTINIEDTPGFALNEIKKQFSPNAMEITPPLDFAGWSEVAKVESRDGRQMIYLKPDVPLREFLKKILERGMPIDQFEIASISLEQIFVTAVKGDSANGPE
jgi:hypothetical protein